MSRSGYSDDLDNWELIKWRGMVASAIRGKRGQKLLVDLVEALDAMPRKTLIAENLIHGGEVCALGAVGVIRGVAFDQIDPYDEQSIGRFLDIAPCLAQEVAFMNDEGGYRETPEQRWQRMRDWAVSQIKEHE